MTAPIRPVGFFTRKECIMLNLWAKHNQTPDGFFYLHSGSERLEPMFDRTEDIKGISTILATKIPKGFLTKSTASAFGVPVFLTDRPDAMYQDEFTKEWHGVYDKRTKLTNPKHRKLNQFEEEIHSGTYPVFRNETRPEHLLGDFNMSHYYLPADAQPAAIYVSSRQSYSYLYDMQEELDRPHYRHSSVPAGFLTKETCTSFGIELEDDERPDAYVEYSSRGYHGVSRLYDKSQHPKYRLKFLFEQNAY